MSAVVILKEEVSWLWEYL